MPFSPSALTRAASLRMCLVEIVYARARSSPADFSIVGLLADVQGDIMCQLRMCQEAFLQPCTIAPSCDIINEAV